MNLYKYSIIMPYYNRYFQFTKTYNRFLELYKNIEIIFIYDKKTPIVDLEGIYKIVKQDAVSVKFFESIADKWVVNPCIAYNQGARESSGNFLIITNPECYHFVDIIKGFEEEFTKNKDCYVVCGCLDGSFKEDVFVSKQWYQHTEHRPANLHFCSALSKENYFKIGGFDEEFAKGIAWEDNDFRDSVKNAGIPFVFRDDLLVYHQSHEVSCKSDSFSYHWELNRFYYENKWRNKNV